MPLLTEGELRQLRAEVALPDTCSVQRATVVRNDEGEDVQTWATVATLACRVASSGLTRFEQEVAQQLEAAAIYAVTLPWDADVTASDRLLWTDALGRQHALDVMGTGDRTTQVQRRILVAEQA